MCPPPSSWVQCLKNVIVTVHTKLAVTHRSPSPSTPSLGGIKSLTDSSPVCSVTNLEDLDLDSDTSSYPLSRPIGESNKFRSTAHVTHISHADIAELEANMRVEESGSGQLLVFASLGLSLDPGLNRIKVHGKVCMIIIRVVYIL